MENNKNFWNQIRYKLVATNRGGELVIEIIDQKLYFIKKAHELLKNTELLSEFSPRDVAIIGVTAGVEIAK
jgi:hypothetical protein